MKSKIQSVDAPAAIGPYSQAIRTPTTVYGSGQTPIDPATGKLVPGGIEEQATRVFKNIRAVLAEAGCTFDNVVKTTVFLQSMDDFAAMNAVYAKFFENDPKPARTTIQAAKLPLGALVEVEFVAVL